MGKAEVDCLTGRQEVEQIEGSGSAHYLRPHSCSLFHLAILSVSTIFPLIVTKWMPHHILTLQHPKAGKKGSPSSTELSFQQGEKSSQNPSANFSLMTYWLKLGYIPTFKPITGKRGNALAVIGFGLGGGAFIPNLSPHHERQDVAVRWV